MIYIIHMSVNLMGSRKKKNFTFFILRKEFDLLHGQRLKFKYW